MVSCLGGAGGSGCDTRGSSPTSGAAVVLPAYGVREVNGSRSSLRQGFGSFPPLLRPIALVVNVFLGYLPCTKGLFGIRGG